MGAFRPSALHAAVPPEAGADRTAQFGRFRRGRAIGWLVGLYWSCAALIAAAGYQQALETYLGPSAWAGWQSRAGPAAKIITLRLAREAALDRAELILGAALQLFLSLLLLALVLRRDDAS